MILIMNFVVLNKKWINSIKDDICDYVREYKPEYMVPSYVYPLDEIPLNVNGKVDKRALPDVNLIRTHAKFVAPRNEKEKEIVEAFQKALSIENISIYDDFISLGGNSLTGIKVLSYLNDNNITLADILSFSTPEAIAKNFLEFEYDSDIYSIENGCPLNGAQLNVFADIIAYNKVDAYHIFSYIFIPEEYGFEKIIDSLKELIKLHPILTMHMSDEYEITPVEGWDRRLNINFSAAKDLTRFSKKLGTGGMIEIIRSYGIRDLKGLYNMTSNITKLFKGQYPYIIKGTEPPIYVESGFDENVIKEFFAEPLNIFNNLAKFLIVEYGESYLLLFSIHHLIFDATSLNVFKKDFQILLDDGHVDYDDKFLEVSAFSHHIKNSEEFDEAGEFYDSMLKGFEDAGELLEDSDKDGYSTFYSNMDINKRDLNSFLYEIGISENVFFTGVFAYTLSKFINTDKVLFTTIDNGRDRFDGDFIDMTANVVPLLIDCKDQSIKSFMNQTAELVYGNIRYSFYPILKLYQKYNFEVKVLFQFLPDWINADLFHNNDIQSLDIVNDIFEDYNDGIADFFVQIFQTGEEYSIVFFNSSKYSKELCLEFKDTFISVVSNIIHMDFQSNLSTILKEGK